MTAAPVTPSASIATAGPRCGVCGVDLTGAGGPACPGCGRDLPTPSPGLRGLVMRGSAWTIAGYCMGQVVRLGSNLILVQFLAPQVFGLMALVSSFMQGLQMFSDVGIGPSIVQHRRGDDP